LYFMNRPSAERHPSVRPIPYWNCTVATWFLRSPAIVVGKDGRARIVYRAEDISGGLPPQRDPTKPPCTAGADMTLPRFAGPSDL
jgi:hypothetical protein